MEFRATVTEDLSTALNGKSDGVAPLRLPLLEVLELDGAGVLKTFPSWMVIPSISKLSSYYLLYGLPPIDEIKVELTLEEETNAASRCHRLRVLSFSKMSYFPERVEAFL